MQKEISQFIDGIIKKLSTSNLSSLEVEFEGMKVRAEKQSQNVVVNNAQAAVPVQQVEQRQEVVANDDIKTVSKEAVSGHVVKSPIVGTCYLSPSPEEQPFVKVGGHVSKGDTVLIVEAMKIMNEIESEFSGTVKEVLVSNGELVEYGQPLIIIE